MSMSFDNSRKESLFESTSCRKLVTENFHRVGCQVSVSAKIGLVIDVLVSIFLRH